MNLAWVEATAGDSAFFTRKEPGQSASKSLALPKGLCKKKKIVKLRKTKSKTAIFGIPGETGEQGFLMCSNCQTKARRRLNL